MTTQEDIRTTLNVWIVEARIPNWVARLLAELEAELRPVEEREGTSRLAALAQEFREKDAA